jgi:hypothetical protein
LFAVLLTVTPCAAQMTQQQAFEAGKQAGRDSTPDYNQILSEENTQTVVPHEQQSEEHSKFWADKGSTITDMVVEGVELLAVCMSGAEGPGDQMRCEAVRMLMGAQQKKPVKEELVKEDDPIFQIRDAIMKNPEELAGAWGGEYTDCQEYTIGGGAEFDYETCTEVASVAGEDEEYCTLGRTVVIDPSRIYQCTRTMSQLNAGQCNFGENVVIDRNTNFLCGKKPENRTSEGCDAMLYLECNKEGLQCNFTGIQLESIQGDMRFQLSDAGGGFSNIFFGTQGDNYWGTGMYDRTLVFNITDIQYLKHFTFVWAAYDDWLRVVVNGTQVYNGPNGGDRLEYALRTKNTNAVCTVEGSGTSANRCTKKVQYAANSFANQELNTSWNVYPNINLAPYLKDGRNEIYTRTIVAGGGEAFLSFSTKIYCECEDVWEDNCATFGRVVR